MGLLYLFYSLIYSVLLFLRYEVKLTFLLYSDSLTSLSVKLKRKS